MQKKKKGDSCKKVKSATGSKGGEANDIRTGKCKYHEKRFEKQLADFSLSRVRDIEEAISTTLMSFKKFQHLTVCTTTLSHSGSAYGRRVACVPVLCIKRSGWVCTASLCTI